MKTIKIILLIIISAIMLYLIGAFVAVSFDIATWDVGGRIFLCLLWISLIVTIFATTE